MQDIEVMQCHEAMLKFLKRQGDDKAKGIERHA